MLLLHGQNLNLAERVKVLYLCLTLEYEQLINDAWYSAHQNVESTGRRSTLRNATSSDSNCATCACQCAV